jgi:hypothetical protein
MWNRPVSNADRLHRCTTDHAFGPHEVLAPQFGARLTAAALAARRVWLGAQNCNDLNKLTYDWPLPWPDDLGDGRHHLLPGLRWAFRCSMTSWLISR